LPRQRVAAPAATGYDPYLCSRDPPKAAENPCPSLPARGGGSKGDHEAEGLGRSRGGFSTTVHLRAEGKGKLLELYMTFSLIQLANDFLRPALAVELAPYAEEFTVSGSKSWKYGLP
jgi:hypothetical protein